MDASTNIIGYSVGSSPLFMWLLALVYPPCTIQSRIWRYMDQTREEMKKETKSKKIIKDDHDNNNYG